MDRLTIAKIGLTLLLVAGATTEAAIIRGVPSCAYWIQQRQPGVGSNYFNEMWLLGYLSGAAVHSGKDILRNTDSESIAVRMDNYCKANSMKSIADGSEVLFDELVRDAVTDQPSPVATARAPVTPDPPVGTASVPAVALLAPAKAPIEPAEASRPARGESPVPAPIEQTYQPKVLTLANSLPLINSKFQYKAEQYAKASGCVGPAATMNIKTATSETFAVSCSNGAALSLRCDPACRDLQ